VQAIRRAQAMSAVEPDNTPGVLVTGVRR